jgi:acetyltransferase
MEKLFYPSSIAIVGLSGKEQNNPKNILENLIRWGYRGRIFGVNPSATEYEVSGIKIYKSATELPEIPDLGVILIPAKYVPSAVDDCGMAGIKRLAILSGGFNESGEEGQKLACMMVDNAKKYGIRFVGPNALTLANTANGMCLPFVPSFKTPKGGLSMITQSGGLGIFLWNLMESENVGMAKFISIGNKLDLDESDFIEYLGSDPETNVICVYLESINDGRKLIAAAQKISKPVIVYKSNTTEAGKKAAMSHTASMSNNEDIIDSAFERAGIIRIDNFRDFITTAKAFDLPPMKGKRIMAMSPAGGLAVSMADICEKEGFEFADPGSEFYRKLSEIANAGIIKFSNPLDMGDIYQSDKYPVIFSRVLENPDVDGAVYVSQWPKMPAGGKDPYTAMFNTDIAKPTIAAIRSSGKPLATVVYGHGPYITKMKNRLSIPVFDGPEEAIKALKRQMTFNIKKAEGDFIPDTVEGIDRPAASAWIAKNNGVIGEESVELLEYYGIKCPVSKIAKTADEAERIASEIGYPVVMKVVSPDAVHKTETGGVLVGINSADEARKGFETIKNNLEAYKKGAVLEGVRITEMASSGHDMFIGGLNDASFGPVVFFGYGGIFVEVFKDVENVLCPSSINEIKSKIQRLKSYKILLGTRGGQAADIDGYADIVLRVSQLMTDFPEIKELDLNPVRILDKGGVLALDARMGIDNSTT